MGNRLQRVHVEINPKYNRDEKIQCLYIDAKALKNCILKENQTDLENPWYDQKMTPEPLIATGTRSFVVRGGQEKEIKSCT